MKKIIAVLTVLGIAFALCSCTAEPKTDIFEFCKRINRADKTAKIDGADFFYDGENEYAYSVYVGAEECLLALITDGEHCVEALRLTTVKGVNQIDPDAFYGFCITLCSVLTGSEKDETAELFGKNGFTAQSVGFNGESLRADCKSFTFFVVTNEEIISFYCTLN